MKYIPIDRAKFKEWHEVFNKQRRFGAPDYVGIEKSSDGREIAVYRSRNAEYRFSKEVSTYSRAVRPTLGRRGFEVQVGLVYFAKKQGGLRGQFGLVDMANFLREAPSRSGRLYDDIRNTLDSLLAVTIRWGWEGRDNSTRKTPEYSFIKRCVFDPRTRLYHYELNPDALGITALWLRGELNAENIGGGYINYPLAYVKERLSETEKAFRDYLLTVPNPVDVRAWTIAKKWCDFSEDALKHRAQSHHRIYSFFRNAVTRGDITSWKASPFRMNTWKTALKITITKPRKSRSAIPGKYRVPSEREQASIDEIVKWMSIPDHNLRQDKDVIRERVTNTVMAHGADVIEEIYEQYALCAYPSVDKFWKGVQALGIKKKMQKLPTNPRKTGSGANQLTQLHIS